MPDYQPRLSRQGMQNNRYWYSSYNIFWATYNPDRPAPRDNWGLPNCTCYAWGRWGEISGGETLHLPTGDAGTWWDSARASGHYQTGQTPQLGAIACYYDPVGMGHVAVVEEIHQDGSITTSNSGYTRLDPSDPTYDWYYFHTYHSPSDYSRPGYVFQGFIYNPYSPHPITGGKAFNALINKTIRKRRRSYDVGRSRRITRRL